MDPTTPMPLPVPVDRTNERRLLLALFVAYLAAGGVLAFACLELASAADQINSAPICRRL